MNRPEVGRNVRFGIAIRVEGRHVTADLSLFLSFFLFLLSKDRKA